VSTKAGGIAGDDLANAKSAGFKTIIRKNQIVIRFNISYLPKNYATATQAKACGYRISQLSISPKTPTFIALYIILLL